MKTSALPKQNQSEKVYARQIAFAAAFLLPAAQFLESPSILAKYAKGDLLLPAIIHFLLQSLVLLAILYAASKSPVSILDRLKGVFGAAMPLIYLFFAFFYLFFGVLPLLDMEKYAYAAFFDTAPTAFSFGPFFLFSAYVCAKGIQSIARSADLCLFLFLFPFLALLAMSLTKADFSSLMPLFGANRFEVRAAFFRTTPHFSNVILLLPLIVRLQYKEGDGVKIMSGYWLGALLSLLFLAIFYAVFSTLAPREHYAFSKIAQYFPALSVIGRFDLIFIYLLSVVLLFYTCLPLQYATECIANFFKIKRKTWISAILHLLLFIGVLFLNKYYDTIYRFISGNSSWIFIIVADMVPPFLIFLPKTKPFTQPIKKEKNHA